MKIKNKKYFDIAKYAFLVGASLILLFFALIYINKVFEGIKFIINILSPFIYGFVIAYLLKPIVNWTEKRCFIFMKKEPVISEEKIQKEKEKLVKIARKYRFNRKDDPSLKGKNKKKKLKIKALRSAMRYVELIAKDEKANEIVKEDAIKEAEGMLYESVKAALIEEKKEKMFSLGRALSVITTYLLLILVMSGIIYILLPQLAESLQTLAGYLYLYVNKALKWANNLDIETISQRVPSMININDVSDILKNLGKEITNITKDFLPWMYQKAAGFTSVVINAVLGVIISIYMLFNKETFAAQIKKILIAFVKEERFKKIISIAKMIDVSFGGFISARVIDSFVIGILCFIGMKIMGAPYAVLISVIIGVTNIIPYVGPFIGGVPSALMILMVDPLKAVIFVIFLIVLQQIDGNVISVVLVGNRTGISAFWVMFSVLVGGGLFGVVGMFIGVPFFVVFHALGGETINSRLVKKGFDTNIEAYMNKIKNEETEEMGKTEQS